MVWSDVLVWFGLSDWDGQVGFVRSGPVCRLCLAWFRWLVRLSQVGLVISGSKWMERVRLVRCGWVGWVWLDRHGQVGRSGEVG